LKSEDLAAERRERMQEQREKARGERMTRREASEGVESCYPLYVIRANK